MENEKGGFRMFNNGFGMNVADAQISLLFHITDQTCRPACLRSMVPTELS